MTIQATRWDLRGYLKRWMGLDFSLGRRGERLAGRWLKRHGYRVLGSNLRNAFGEVDLLVEAPDRRTVVVVEVKTAALPDPPAPPAAQEQTPAPVNDARPDAGRGWLPEVHVNRHKQRQLIALAGQLAKRCGLTDRPIRFDVIGVDLPAHGLPAVRHHVGAFDSHI